MGKWTGRILAALACAGLLLGGCSDGGPNDDAPGGAGGGDAGAGGTGAVGGAGGDGGGAGGGSGGSGGQSAEGWSLDALTLSPSGVLTARISASETITASLGVGSLKSSGRGPRTDFTLAIALPPGEHLALVTVVAADEPDRIQIAKRTVTVPEPDAPALVLFDAAHGQTSGNADWVIDHPDERHPTPADPQTAEDWSGAFSSFGFGLHDTGRFTVRTLPRGERLDAAELDGVRVLVLPEPNQPYSSAEKAAIWRFVQEGGGLYLLANHAGADRDNDGWDAAEVAADLLGAAPTGIGIVPADIERVEPTRALDDHAILTGPFGQVNALTFFDATTLSVSGDAQAIVHAPASQGILGAAANYGAGRVLVIGDSAGADDGTGWPQDNLFDGWSDYDNAAFYLNGASWLAGEIAD